MNKISKQTNGHVIEPVYEIWYLLQMQTTNAQTSLGSPLAYTMLDGR